MNNNDYIRAAVKAAKTKKQECDIKNEDWTYLPGTEALKVNPDIIGYLAPELNSVMVTGTNGKTTTVNMISEMLSAENTENICNRIGTNLPNGIATALCLNCDDNYHAKIKCAVLECDEMHTLTCMPQVNPGIVVITNIYRDQFSRFQGEENAANDIVCAMKNTTPGICCIDEECRFIEKFTSIKGWKYSFFSVDGEDAVVDGEHYPLKLSIPGEYNRRNAAAAIAAVKAMGKLGENGLSAVSKMRPVFGRNEFICRDGVNIRMILAKNTAGWNVTLNTLSEICEHTIPRLYLVINDFAGDDRDHTWIVSNDYQPLFKYFDVIYLSGSCGDLVKKEILKKMPDCADRISSIETDKIIPKILSQKELCFIICSYSAMISLRNELAENGIVKPMWIREND